MNEHQLENSEFQEQSPRGIWSLYIIAIPFFIVIPLILSLWLNYVMTWRTERLLIILPIAFPMSILHNVILYMAALESAGNLETLADESDDTSPLKQWQLPAIVLLGTWLGGHALICFSWFLIRDNVTYGAERLIFWHCSGGTAIAVLFMYVDIPVDRFLIRFVYKRPPPSDSFSDS